MRKLLLATTALVCLSSAAHAACALGGTDNGGFCKTGTSTQVSVNIQVPSVGWNNPGNNSPTMSGWVGIGDISNTTLIQFGWALSVSSNGTVSTEMFYEVLPASLHPITSGCVGDTTCKVHQFDVISLDIHCLTNCTPNNAASTWSMFATNCGVAGPGCASPLWTWDSTSAVGTITYSDSLATAQWVTEDNPAIFRYPYFGKVVYQNSLWNNANPVFDYNQEGTASRDGNGTWANYGPQNSTTDGFNTCYGASFFLCDSNTYFGKDKGSTGAGP
jgi:hypothetical protein